jgi:hypothetical protein
MQPNPWLTISSRIAVDCCDMAANLDATWMPTWMRPGCQRGCHLAADVVCHLAADVACHMAADLNGFNDMDNDAVCHMAADVAVT